MLQPLHFYAGWMYYIEQCILGHAALPISLHWEKRNFLTRCVSGNVQEMFCRDFLDIS